MSFLKEYDGTLLISEKRDDWPYAKKHVYYSLRRRKQSKTILGTDTINSPIQICDYNYDANGKLARTKEFVREPGGSSRLIDES